MKKDFPFRFLALVILLTLPNTGLANVASKVLSETVEQACKISGQKAIPQAAKVAAEKALEETVAKYGDDVLRTVRIGGLEALEQGTKHGDDFWRLCAQVPEGARSLALYADELMPLAKRIGPDVLRLEAKLPGITTRVVSNFGDDAVRVLNQAPKDDIVRMVGYAQKADTPETQKLLFQCYKDSKNRSKFLSHLDWKKIMAGGLSAAVITAAYNVSDGIHDAVNTVAVNSPEHLPQTLDSAISPFRYVFYTALAILALYVLYLFRWPLGQFARRVGSLFCLCRKPKTAQAQTPQEEKPEQE